MTKKEKLSALIELADLVAIQSVRAHKWDPIACLMTGEYAPWNAYLSELVSMKSGSKAPFPEMPTLPTFDELLLPALRVRAAAAGVEI